jgi:hypothetical protein
MPRMQSSLDNVSYFEDISREAREREIVCVYYPSDKESE